MVTNRIDDLIQEKIEFDDTYREFISAELCEDCPMLNCTECRYNKNSYSTNGGENNGTTT